MYRRRDSQPGRAAHSSADAYRALNSPASSNSHAAHNDSSEDESNLQPNTPIAQAFICRRPNDPAPLSPPRPPFIASETRSSWSASSENASFNGEQSDSDSSPAPAANPASDVTATRSLVRATSRPRSQTQPTDTRVRDRSSRRRSFVVNQYSPEAPSEDPTTAEPLLVAPPSNPFDTPTNSFYGAMPAAAYPPMVTSPRAPPSSFPFQSHPGNPDPGTPIPGMGRRTSIESIRAREAAQRAGHQRTPSFPGTVYPPGTSGAGYGLIAPSNASIGDLEGDLGRPYAPFMEHLRDGRATPTSQSRLYMNSAAAAMTGSSYAINAGYGPSDAVIPRTQSSPAINMRAPFLSPASRPNSSLWSPPSYSTPYPPGQASSLQSVFPRKVKPPMPSSRLSHKLSKEDKPWLRQRDWRDRTSWWLTFLTLMLGFIGGGVLCFFGWKNTELLNDSDLCMVLDENFDTLDTNTWTRDVELGGFGNGEFQMTTDSNNNLFVQNGELYILPTLTSDVIGRNAILDGGKYNLEGCTSTNKTACSVTSVKDKSTIPPIQSARISTQSSASIAFGKVEVRAKLPRGDWLWPAIWMLPKDSVYGQWPLSGEIDIMEARGNGPSYPAQGVNFVRASLNYGVLQSVQTHLFGWWSQKQSSYDKAFHTYAIEWTPSWMRFYVDSRLQAMMNIQITGKNGKDFFKRGNYPATATNGSAVAVVVSDIWQNAGGSPAAPFDQQFYLILDVAAGGTSGWFPDYIGNKPWFDSSSTAMTDFAKAQDTWAATWPSSQEDRAMRIDYVKMWKLGSC